MKTATIHWDVSCIPRDPASCVTFVLLPSLTYCMGQIWHYNIMLCTTAHVAAVPAVYTSECGALLHISLLCSPSTPASVVHCCTSRCCDHRIHQRMWCTARRLHLWVWCTACRLHQREWCTARRLHQRMWCTARRLYQRVWCTAVHLAAVPTVYTSACGALLYISLLCPASTPVSVVHCCTSRCCAGVYTSACMILWPGARAFSTHSCIRILFVFFTRVGKVAVTPTFYNAKLYH